MKKKKILSLLLALAMSVSLITPTKAEAKERSNSVSTMVKYMPLRDKITQMLMVDFRYWDENTTDDVAQTGFEVMNDQVKKIVEDYNFGAIIYFAQNLTGTEQAFNLTKSMQEAATKDGGIPMLISADQEGGSVYRLATGTALPGNMALGATGNTEYSKLAGGIIGSELSSLGINTTLAPVVDVNNNANNPVIGLRSYSDDPTIVGQMASASIAGLAEHNVIGCAKHFPGHGDTATDSHYGLPSVDKSYEVLKENELAPYEIAIEQGIEMVMTAHILYPQLESDTIVSNKTGQAESLPATMSDDIITGLLKEKMGFEGIVCTDAMNMAGISDKWDQVQSVVIAISAGVDMICMPTTLYNLNDLANLDAIIEGVEAAVTDGTIPMERIDDAVTRILTVKENRGILDYNEADYTLEKALATVGSDENRETEREIAAAAVTVVKNENNTLPLNITSESKVLMMVPYNNERGQMIMAWNRAKEAGLIPEEAEVDVVRFSSDDLNAVKDKIDWADTIIINSEVSRADRMAYDHWLSAAPNTFVNYAKENGKTTVVQSVDKPYDVQLYPNADAILAVYGCKGSAVDPTEALVGGATNSEAAYGPNIIAGVEVALGVFGAKGTLPVNIPKFDNTTDTYTDEILYARGFGITYDALTDTGADTEGETGSEGETG
ncbi:MAG: beta-hexosaminidase, partial [Clostridium sartagoforme]|nr:beta-hexosaminidase [Clostridium sartagoforme]